MCVLVMSRWDMRGGPGLPHVCVGFVWNVCRRSRCIKQCFEWSLL